MINIFKIKRWSALFLAAFLPTISFAVGSMYYGFFMAILIMLVVSIISVFLGGVILKNPFSLMLEGKGLLCFDVNSTGLMQPFLLGVDKPYLKGNIEGKQVNDVFNRDAVFSMETPIENGNITYAGEDKDSGEDLINITIKKSNFDAARFSMFGKPVLIYNGNINSLLTKGFLSGQEKEVFSEHGLLYLNRKTEDLCNQLRDFGRYIVESLKPKESIFKNKIVMWILIIGLIIVAIALSKPIWSNLLSAGGSAISSGSSALSSAAAVIPR